MAEVVHDAQQDFWRPPAVREDVLEVAVPAPVPERAGMCSRCETEFMIGAKFCHACGVRRPVLATEAGNDVSGISGLLGSKLAWLRSLVSGFSWQTVRFPSWLHYLHFHEIQSWVGLPTASLVSFLIGMGCVAGAVGVSLFYRASNMAEFQAIQMWRIEWLLGATASFVAGILLKKPSDRE